MYVRHVSVRKAHVYRYAQSCSLLAVMFYYCARTKWYHWLYHVFFMIHGWYDHTCVKIISSAQLIVMCWTNYHMSIRFSCDSTKNRDNLSALINQSQPLGAKGSCLPLIRVADKTLYLRWDALASLTHSGVSWTRCNNYIWIKLSCKDKTQSLLLRM